MPHEFLRVAFIDTLIWLVEVMLMASGKELPLDPRYMCLDSPEPLFLTSYVIDVYSLDVISSFIQWKH